MGRIIPYIMENKIHVWNHQPDILSIIVPWNQRAEPIQSPSHPLPPWTRSCRDGGLQGGPYLREFGFQHAIHLRSGGR